MCIVVYGCDYTTVHSFKFFPCPFQEWFQVSYKEEQPMCLSLWWDSCCRAWIRETFSFVWGSHFLFFFHLRLFNDVCFQYSQILAIFIFSECTDSFLIWQFCWILTGKIPFTWRLSCVSGITGYASITQSKHNHNEDVPSAKVPRKLRRSHARLEACPRVTRRQDMWRRVFARASGKLCITGKISIPAETSGQRRRPAEGQLDVKPLWALALDQTAQSWKVEKSLSCIRLTKREASRN